jgi:hypothetical protein
MIEKMKTLAELRIEVELGLWVYPSINHDVSVFLAEGWYIFSRSQLTPVEQTFTTGERVLIGGDFKDGAHIGGGVIFDNAYKTFDALLAGWPSITSQPVWSTAKTPERLQYEQEERERWAREQEKWDKNQHNKGIGGSCPEF